MIKTTSMLIEECAKYKSPANKIGRMAKNGEIIPIVKGIYETNASTSGYLLAGSIYGPSYLSFEFALSRYELIPEAVYTFTSATYEKKKRKQYDTPFGTFIFRDVPSEAYPNEIKVVREGEYIYQIASAEKALCDTLYIQKPAANQKELKVLMFDLMRIDEVEFQKLDKNILIELSEKYHSTNLKLLKKVLLRKRG